MIRDNCPGQPGQLSPRAPLGQGTDNPPLKGGVLSPSPVLRFVLARDGEALSADSPHGGYHFPPALALRAFSLSLFEGGLQ